jgi:hypothetical protein
MGFRLAARSPRVAAPATASPAVALGCLVLFAVPFLGVGLFTLTQALVKLRAGDLAGAGFLGAFGAVFGGVGGGMVALGIRARNEAARAAALRTRYPEEPWRWRTAWSTGRIADGTRPGEYVLWFLAALWNLIAWPALFLGGRQALSHATPAAWVVVIFPLVGIGLAVAATQATLRYRKYGTSYLELATMPGVIGHGLRGTVVASPALEHAGQVHVTLSCVRITISGSGNSQTTSETIVWRDEGLVQGQRGVGGPGEGVRVRLPVAFRVPADVPPSDTSQTGSRIEWRLELAAAVPGIDYRARFDVPVFRTAESDRPLAPEQDTALGPALAPIRYQRPQNSPIRVTESGRRVEVFYPPARNPSVAFAVTLFSAIWIGLIWLMATLKAPLFFVVVFSAFGAVLVWITLRLWLRVVQVSASPEGLTVASGLGRAGAPRRLLAAEIASVDTRIGMQSGTTVYYDVVVRRKDGGTVEAGGGIADKREAEWLAARLTQALGRSDDAPDSGR